VLNEPLIDKSNLPFVMANMAIDDGSPLPIYEQICRTVRTAISNGDLPRGTQLPTTRDLAEVLKVGRNTVVTAYLRLSAEGFVVTNRRRGTRVSEDWTQFSLSTSGIRLEDDGATIGHVREQPIHRAAAAPVTISYRARELLDEHASTERFGRSVSLHSPDPSLYPRNPLSRLLAEEFCRPPGTDFDRGAHRFQSAVAQLLRQMRGVVCEPEQIIPVVGIESAVDLVSRVLLDPGHCVYFEDPGHEFVLQNLTASGAQIIPIPSDGKGADISRVYGPPARLIYVSPSVGFPFGQQMSEDRRLALLDAARGWNSIVFENDSHWELSYAGCRLRALQGRSDQTPVVYFAALSSTLGPHIRIGYLVVPPDLVKAFNEMAQRMACVPDCFVLGALATFIESSEYAVHTRKLRTIYSQRVKALSGAMRSRLSGITVLEPDGGLNLTALLDDDLDEQTICDAANSRGVAAAALSQFYCERRGFKPPQGLVLGLGNLPDRTIDSTVDRLQNILRDGRRAIS